MCVTLAAYAAKSRFGLRVAEALMLVSKNNDARPREIQRLETLHLRCKFTLYPLQVFLLSKQ
jgi:hypothetical protein